MLESRKRPELYRRGLIVLTAVCIGAYLLTYAIMNIYGFKLYCNTDMYADTLIARLMWEQKSLFPEGWVFSNQYYVVATPVLAALFYGVIGDVNIAMVLATEVMTVLILLSFLYLIRAFTEDPLAYLLGCLLLMASVIAPDIPENRPSQIFFVQASYYACYLIGFFVVVGDYIRCFQTKQRRIGAWVLSLFLSFALGIQSLRQTVAMVLPIAACEIFLALRRLLYKQKPWSRENVGSLIRALSYGIANLAGLVTLERIDPLHTAVYGSFQLTPLDQIWERFYPIWPAFQVISGLKYGFGENGSPFLAFVSLFCIGIVAAAAVLWLLRIRRPENPLELCWLVCLVGIVGTALSTVVTGVNIRHIYLFLWYPLVAFSALLIFLRLPIWGRGLAVVLVCVLSLGNLTHGYTLGAETALQNSPSYAGKAFRMARAYGMKSYAYDDEAYADARELCAWAQEEGFRYVYGDWYTAPKIAVHSGGELTAGYWWQESMYVPNDHLTSQQIYDEADNAEAIYVFTSKDEKTGLALALEKGATLTKAAQFGDYRAYTASKQLFERPWE